MTGAGSNENTSGPGAMFRLDGRTALFAGGARAISAAIADLHRQALLAFLSLLAGAALTACTGENDAAAPKTPPPAQVTVVTLKEQTVTLTRELPGRTSPYVVAEVRPQATGIVKARMFKEGSLVKAGQPLYQLEDSTYRADVVVARAQVARAEATANAAGLTARRTAELAALDAVSRQENENAVAALRLAEADVAAAKAALQRAEVILGYTRITSPVRGRIGKSTVTQGALVNADELSGLFRGGSFVWSIMPSASLPIFTGGRLDANLEAARAGRDIALALYERAIQAGFRDVADALVLSRSLAGQRAAQEALLEASTRAEALSRARYDSGRDSFLVLLDAQRTLYAAEQGLIATRLAEQANRVTLYKVLGGGWQ